MDSVLTRRFVVVYPGRAKFVSSIVVMLPIEWTLDGQSKVEIHALNPEGSTVYRRIIHVGAFPDLEYIGKVVMSVVMAEARVGLGQH